MCPPQSLHDRIVKHLPLVRSYLIKDGHLFLSLMADGGIYEFEPAPGASSATKSPVATTGPVVFTCGGGDTVRATFYKTQPALVLLERGGVTRPAFSVRSASGAQYQGDDVLFWEARGEATLEWSGTKLTCMRQ